MENSNTPIDNLPYPGNRYDEYLNQPLSVGDWVITILITAIPVVGLIMLFIWAFSSDTNLNKSNWAKATLIWYAIGIVIGGIVFSMIGAAFFAENWM
jgi:cell division protein FtsW (lipid II flippase)